MKQLPHWEEASRDMNWHAAKIYAIAFALVVAAGVIGRYYISP